LQQKVREAVKPADGTVDENVIPENGQVMFQDALAGGHGQNGHGLKRDHPPVSVRVARQQQQQPTVQGAHGGHAANEIHEIGSPGSSPTPMAACAACAHAVGISIGTIANAQTAPAVRKIQTNSFPAVSGFISTIGQVQFY